MKTRLLSLILILCCCIPSFAQRKPMPKIGEDGVYFYADKMPEFPGGQDAMFKYLRENVRYPVNAQKNGITGRVMVQFVIQEDGTLDNVKILRSVSPELDNEAMRVVQAMPKWSPGVDDGKAVKVKFTIPISFNLTKSTEPTSFERRLPAGHKIKNKTLTGVWQSCSVRQDKKDYVVVLSPVAIMKILSADKTFLNIFAGNQQTGAIIMAQGEYNVTSDSTYVETLKQSMSPVFAPGSQNGITYEFLHDDLIKLTFILPGKDELYTEYWFRVKMPEISLMAN